MRMDNCCDCNQAPQFGIYQMSARLQLLSQCQCFAAVAKGDSSCCSTWHRATNSEYADLFTEGAAIINAYNLTSPPVAWKPAASSGLGGPCGPGAIDYYALEYRRVYTDDLWTDEYIEYVNDPSGKCGICAIGLTNPYELNNACGTTNDIIIVSRLWIVPTADTQVYVSDSLRNKFTGELVSLYSCSQQSLTRGVPFEVSVPSHYPANGDATTCGYRTIWFGQCPDC